MALQQLSMCASLLLGADAAALAALADCLAAVAGATSFTALVGALTEALAAHVRERYLLEPRVVAAFVPEPSSAVGLLFGAGGGGGGGGGRGTSASAVPANSPAFGLVDTMESPASANRSVHVKEGLLKRSPSTRSMAAAPLGTASPDAKRASAAVAVARVARIVDGAATRAHSESTARRIRRIIPSGPVGLAAAAHVCVPDPTMSSGGHAGGAATGTAGYASTSRGRAAASLGAAAPRVVALSNADVAAIDATAAAGSGVTTLRVKPFPLNNTLLRQLCASALVARKVTGGLAAEVETLATAAPGASYAVVQDHHHRTADLLNAEHGGTRGGSGGQQELMTAPANVMMGFLGSGSLSSAFASSAAGLRGLTASIRSVGGMRAGGGGGAGAGGTSIAIPEDDTERLDPLLASLEPEILYDTGCTDRSGEGRRVVALTSSALNAATMMDSSSTHGGAGKPTGGGGGGTAPAVPTARSRATSANISHGALAMVGIANATAGGGSAVAEMVLCSPLRENTPTGMSPPACGSSSAHDTGLLLVGQTQPRRITRSTSVIHMEEMDPVQNTMRAQMPLLVASLQTSISNARSEAALVHAAANAALPRSGSSAHLAGYGGGAGSSGPVSVGAFGRQQSQLAPASATPRAGQSDLDQLQLVSQLGVGGCAVVFRGRLGTLDCAIKLMEMPDVDEELGSSQRLGTISSGGGGGTASAAGGGGGGATGPAGIPVAAAVAADADAAAERERVMARRAMLRNAMEMAAMQMISHPNVMQVYSTFTNVTLGRCAKPDGSDYLFLKSAGEVEKGPGAPPICLAIVCEWCDQACLATALHNRTFPVTLGRMAPTPQNPRGPRMYDYTGIMMTLLDMAMALKHLHANQLIHRDIKPANILLKTNTMDRRGFTAKLADFGFVTLLNMPGDALSGGEPFVFVEEACGT
eukprot:XP_001701895.1 predicted protein [Chlamydomonas reinhardtii]